MLADIRYWENDATNKHYVQLPILTYGMQKC